MINLPEDLNISVKKLSSCFNNTTASYKFYWFLAILNSVSSKKEVVSKKELFCRMISISWFTVNYFHVSFGKFDKLQEAIIRLKVKTTDFNISKTGWGLTKKNWKRNQEIRRKRFEISCYEDVQAR